MANTQSVDLSSERTEANFDQNISQVGIDYTIINNHGADTGTSTHVSNFMNLQEPYEVKYISNIPAGTDSGDFHFSVGQGANINLSSFQQLGEHVNTTVNLAPDSTLHITADDIDSETLAGMKFDMTSDGNSTLIFDSVSGLDGVPSIEGLSPGDVIQLNDAASGAVENGQIVFHNSQGNVVGKFDAPDQDLSNVVFDGNTMSYACYLRGTHIATPNGEVQVEDLQAGDKVLTASGGIATVKWLGYRTLYKGRIPVKDAKRAFPILFKRGCIADNVPHRDLIMSPGHHVSFDGNLVSAMNLVNGKSIVQLFDLPSFQYFHIELEQFDILLAEGVPAESYVDTGNRNMFQNAHEVALNPDFGPAAGRPDVPGITIVRKGPVFEGIRAKLLERANWMQVPEAKKLAG